LEVDLLRARAAAEQVSRAKDAWAVSLIRFASFDTAYPLVWGRAKKTARELG